MEDFEVSLPSPVADHVADDEQESETETQSPRPVLFADMLSYGAFSITRAVTSASPTFFRAVAHRILEWTDDDQKTADDQKTDETLSAIQQQMGILRIDTWSPFEINEKIVEDPCLTNCAICCLPIESRENIYMWPTCQHFYHMDCARNMYEHSKFPVARDFAFEAFDNGYIMETPATKYRCCICRQSPSPRIAASLIHGPVYNVKRIEKIRINDDGTEDFYTRWVDYRRPTWEPYECFFEDIHLTRMAELRERYLSRLITD